MNYGKILHNVNRELTSVERMLDTLERNWVEGKKPSLHAPPVQTILREVESLRDTLRCARLRIERVQATMEFEVAKAEGKIQ